MKLDKIIFILLTVILSVGCSEDALNSNSIFEGEETQRTDFEEWLYKNYTVPYNLDFKYRFDDKESNESYNLAPADYDKSVAMAKLTKFLWFETYSELTGSEIFMKKYSPRMIHLVGSPAFNSQGSIVLGTAEGGLKVTLYNINMIDLSEIDVDVLNYWYFKTMHHEFMHILHQTKNFSTDFNLISAADYQSTSWVNVSLSDANKMGFVSSYASSESNEDFVETIAVYITNSEAYWQNLLTTAGTAGAAIILEKLEFVKEYLYTTWDIDIVTLRAIIERRSSEIDTIDLSSLN